MSLTNEVLYADRNEYFVTLMFGHIGMQTTRFRYTLAGHQSWCLLMDGAGIELEATGTALGVLAGKTWEVAESPPMEEGDLLVITTDGITQAMLPVGDCFGDGRALDCLQRNRTCGVEVMVQSVRRELIEFTGTRPQQDDMNIVLAIRVKV